VSLHGGHAMLRPYIRCCNRLTHILSNEKVKTSAQLFALSGGGVGALLHTFGSVNGRHRRSKKLDLEFFHDPRRKLLFNLYLQNDPFKALSTTREQGQWYCNIAVANQFEVD